MLCSKKRKRKKMDVTVCVCTTVPMSRKERRRKKHLVFVCHCSDDTENQYVWHTLIYCLKLGFLLLFVLFGVINKCMSMFLCDTQVLLSLISAAVSGKEKHGSGKVQIVSRHKHWTNRPHWCVMYWIFYGVIFL